MNKCPGTDTSYRKSSDVFDVTCPECAADVELFVDDRKGTCQACGTRFDNPHFNPEKEPAPTT